MSYNITVKSQYTLNEMEDPCCMLISPDFLEAILVQEKKRMKKQLTFCLSRFLLKWTPVWSDMLFCGFISDYQNDKLWLFSPKWNKNVNFLYGFFFSAIYSVLTLWKVWLVIFREFLCIVQMFFMGFFYSWPVPQ